MLNPDHATKAATIDRALRRLGKHVGVTVGEGEPRLVRIRTNPVGCTDNVIPFPKR